MLPIFQRGRVRTRRGSRYYRICIEQLEDRTLLSVFAPGQIRHAYGFDQVTFSSGGQVIPGDGRGQTIAIVDAYYDSHILNDLVTFDNQWGLAHPSFTQYVQQGAGTNSGWALETALDVEWAHVTAPGAAIVLVEAANASVTNLMAAVDFARNLPGVSTISMSWGANEKGLPPSLILSYDSTFTTPAGHTGVTFIASSGDSGAVNGPEWPAVSPNVMAVGGTTLRLTASNDWSSETAWSGSGGGQSAVESKPSYQSSVQSSSFRQVPDVAYNADPNTGVYVYNSGWYAVGGTSAGAPQWAGLLAVANQGRVLNGLGTLDQGQAAMYALPSSDFHDITSGSNGYTAGPGFDLVTGLGSPKANLVIADLAKPPSGGGGGGGGGGGTGGGTGSGGTGDTGGTLPPPPGQHAVTDQPVILFTDGAVSVLFFQHAPSGSFVNSNSARPATADVPPQLLNSIEPPRITTSATTSLLSDLGGGSSLSWTAGDVIDTDTPELRDRPAGTEKTAPPAKSSPAPATNEDGAQVTRQSAIDAVFAEGRSNGSAQGAASLTTETGEIVNEPVEHSAVVALACILGGYWALPERDEERKRRSIGR